MGSVGNPTTWPPYENYRDCSLGICSIYCPQWCYMIFPPPPPFQSHDSDSGTNFSPLIIAVIGILASTFLLVTYYTIISKYCKRRSEANQTLVSEINQNQNHNMDHEQFQLASTGMDESLIKSITVCKYRKGEKLIEGTDCAVCLSEFEENENLRLLPKCNHAFHLTCIDTWLRSHSNCPLCRSNATPGSVVSVPSLIPSRPPSLHNSSRFNISSLEFHRRDDVILVVEETERGYTEEVVVSLDNISELTPKPTLQITRGENQENGKEGVPRSYSWGPFSCQRNLLVSDILMIDEDYNNDGVVQTEGIGTSNNGIASDSITMHRSISTGGLVFASNDKGKTSILPI